MASTPEWQNLLEIDLMALKNSACGLEGVGGRDKDCFNNPRTHSKTHRPELCQECISDPTVHRLARNEVVPNPYRQQREASGLKHFRERRRQQLNLFSSPNLSDASVKNIV